MKFSHFTPFIDSGTPKELLERATSSAMGRTYKGVTIVKVGPGNKQDNNYYPEVTLKEGARSKIFEGLRAFADHPTSVDEQILPERSIRDIVGIYTNTKFSESNGGRVVGDLTVFPHATWLSQMIDQLIRMKQTDKIGISINGAGKTIPKKVRLSESGEPQEVNWLESFHVLRSADVVTEAGAGGGFQRILESARAARGKTKMKLTPEQQKKLNEATAKGDSEEISRLLTEFTEANKNGGATPHKPKGAQSVKPPVKPKKGTEGEELEEVAAAEGGDDPDPEEPDHAAVLDQLADQLAESATNDDQDPDAAEGEEIDPDGAEGDDPDAVSESDDLDDDPEDEDVREANAKLRKSLILGAQAIRAVAKRNPSHSKQLEEAASNLEEAGKMKKGKGKGGYGKAMVMRGGTLEKTVKGKVSVPGQKKWKMAEAEKESPEIAALRRQLHEATGKINRLSTQLRTRQSVDRAKKLLKESQIPERLRPAILKKIAKLGSEEEMRTEIEYNENLVTTTLEEAASSMDLDMDFDQIEGAPSGRTLLRESGSGGNNPTADEDFFQEMGLPLKQKQ